MWSGLVTGERYLGVVTYGNADQTLAGVTTLYVEPGAASSATSRRASAFTQALVRKQRLAAKPAAARR